MTQERVEEIRERSNKGNRVCSTVLAAMYERGVGVPQDIPKAKALYQSAADGDGRVYYQLGRMAEDGVGESPDYVKARQYYRRAANAPEDVSGKAGLAKLMEDGKGGPQDLEGALALYLSAMESIDDDSWKGVERLRAEGLTLTIPQKNRYNQVWAHTVSNRINRKNMSAGLALLKTFKPRSVSKPVKVQFEYTLGSLVPQLSVFESSGDNAFDKAAVEALSDFRFPQVQPMMPEGQKSLQFIGSVKLRGF
ncbi:sel1 repeat family protein [Pseudomonas sp. CCM 7893]|uniref:Sel1 repeat family protein n=1 Tax=Pseudomonas spelaei TaxID=1055469 RepID=A0A6I3WJE2_9PSED|nr:SEL1-like repeat protein [Pseudomonas spelaei]MUF07433.1 sel1 repeat family protein [Pseudomonas spelaei]QLG94169.1 SEL1-like repeat protein [Pseudomonas yamanorum]